MRYILLIFASSVSLAVQAISPQANRPYTHAESYGQAQSYRWQQPNRGQFQTYGQPYYNPYYSPYYNPYYTPYEPDNGPMRGPNSIEGHQHNFYRP